MDTGGVCARGGEVLANGVKEREDTEGRSGIPTRGIGKGGEQLLREFMLEDCDGGVC